ncbi:MAG TPA: hypothetical protein VJ810_19085 [Blastocatellia bacterium]|nr:hypothetical protein [Blastocatellia bacterium]
MNTTKLILAILVCSFLSTTPAFAQEPQSAKASRDTSSREVTIVIKQQQLFFTASVSVQELRLEVHDKNGELVYDSGFVTGGELSWALRNASGGEIPGGLYAYKLTIKKTDDEAPVMRRGHMILERGRDQLWVTNNGAIGVEEAINGGDVTVSSGADVSLAGAQIGKVGEIVMTPNAMPLDQVAHDASLMGDGTAASPLGIANGGVTGTKIAAGQVVKNLNGLADNVILTAGPNIMITPSGNSLNISAPNLLSVVSHDTTLAGSGTTAAPLRIASPLFLTGSDPISVINTTNNSPFGAGLVGKGLYGVRGLGNDSKSTLAGDGVVGKGGNSDVGSGGDGVDVRGGDSNSSYGGSGVMAAGGNSDSGLAGTGVTASAGNSNSGFPGTGVFALGGDGALRNGGEGAYLIGGDSDKSYGGIGIAAYPGRGPAGNGVAGVFGGDVNVHGNLSKGGGSFKIDHPLDPANKYLYHSFVESPDMMNVYNGNITTDANGDATVTLPDYFEALNRDFRYQLTVIGQFAQAIVANEISGNSFMIKTDRPGVKVSWQVTGIRRDAYANKHRIPVEEAKPERERGYYLHPQVFEQPEEKSLEWARNPEMMKQLKSRRQEAELRRLEKENDR